MEAAHHNNIDTLLYLLRHRALLGLDLNAADDVGRNVLFYLLEQDGTDVIDTLLTAGVQVSG